MLPIGPDSPLVAPAQTCVLPRPPRERPFVRLRPDRPGRLACVNTRTAWIAYIVLRLVFLAVPFAVLMIIGWPWWLALAVSTLIALSLSIIFLSKPRETASTSIYEWRNRDRTADDVVEDEAVEAAESIGQAAAAETTGIAEPLEAESADPAEPEQPAGSPRPAAGEG